jgi:hypothetical protein
VSPRLESHAAAGLSPFRAAFVVAAFPGLSEAAAPAFDAAPINQMLFNVRREEDGSWISRGGGCRVASS